MIKKILTKFNNIPSFSFLKKDKKSGVGKKSLEKIELDEIKPSNRRYPYVDFKPDREPGKEILHVKNISKNDIL